MDGHLRQVQSGLETRDFAWGEQHRRRNPRAWFIWNSDVCKKKQDSLGARSLRQIEVLVSMFSSLARNYVLSERSACGDWWVQWRKMRSFRGKFLLVRAFKYILHPKSLVPSITMLRFPKALFQISVTEQKLDHVRISLPSAISANPSCHPERSDYKQQSNSR